MRARTRATAVVLMWCFAVAAACGGDGGSRQPSDGADLAAREGDALRSQTAPGGGRRVKPGLVVGDGRVLGYTAAYLDVETDVTLKAVEPADVSNLEVVHARIAYIRRALDGF